MFKSRAAKELMTVMEPVKKLVMATAMVTEAMNMHSWNVDVKHSGRALGSCSLVGWWWEREAASSASGPVSAPMSSGESKVERHEEEEELDTWTLRLFRNNEARIR
jgi:hypothetical protein